MGPMNRIARLLAALILIGATAPGSAAQDVSLRDALKRLDALSAYHQKISESVGAAVVGITCELLIDGRKQGYFGTGVLVSPTGLILTSTTVIPPGSTSIKIFRKGGEVMNAKIVEHDDKTESILVKVSGRKLPYVKLADSSRTDVGDMAYTFGNPYGTIAQDDQVSFSVGTVSGIYEMESGDYQSEYKGTVIETDAAVNPGSDGGPLVDVQGRLLGIISLAYSENRWLGTVVPIHLIKKRLPSISRKRASWLRAVRGEQARRTLNILWAVENTVQAAAKKIDSAVVRIDVEREGREGKREKPNYLNFRARQRDLQERLTRRPAGAVTGLLIDRRKGYVLTSSYNVIEGVKSIRVTFANGRSVDAELLGRHVPKDIALLKLKGRVPASARAVKLDATVKADLGSFVAVVARSQKSKKTTLNTGIVSATKRYRGSAFQTDALINFGNAGGPVIDLTGRVVGIAAHVNPKTPWSQNSGVAFATTAAAILESLKDLEDGKVIEKVARPFLGVTPALGAMDIVGVKIDRVMPGTAAEKAGIKNGDVIVEIDGKPIKVWAGLSRAIVLGKVGQKLAIVVRRDGKRVTLQATLQARPE